MKRNKQLIFILVLSVSLIFSCSAGRGENGADEEQGSGNPAVDGSISQMEPVSETELTDADVERLSADLGVEIEAGVNEFYEIDGVEVQINWLIPSEPDDLVGLYDGLFGAVGSENAVILGTDRVYEVRCTVASAAIEAISMLETAPLQSVKLTPYQLGSEATLLQDEWISGEDLENVVERLGFELDALINQNLDFGGDEVQVNFMLPGQGESADSLYETLVELKGTEVGLYVYENAVVEVVTTDEGLASDVMELVTGESPEGPQNTSDSGGARYVVEFTVIPVASVDYMKMNECSLEAEDGGDAGDLENIDPTIEFGSQLPVFMNEENTELSTVPDFVLEMIDDSVGIATIDVGAQKGDMPEVEVTMVVEPGRVLNTPPADVDRYLGATDWWPVGSERIVEIVDDVVGDGLTDREKVRALHHWVRENIDYGGEVVGSRWGVSQVLRQEQGRCWDHSDVFITLARTAGIPARQIGGWLYDLDGGHIWSQVWLEDEGVWLGIDTTAEDVGVDDTYIPLWGTIDGEMMFIYREDPEISRSGD